MRYKFICSRGHLQPSQFAADNCHWCKRNKKKTMTNWADQKSDPLNDLEIYSKLNKEQKSIDDKDLIFFVSIGLVIDCIKKDRIDLLWQAPTIMITNEAIRLLQKYCLKKMKPMPGKYILMR